MKKIVFNLIVCFFIILTVVGCSNDNKNNEGNNTSTGTNENSSEPTYSPDELSKNITNEVATAKNGSLLVIAKNNNKVAVDMEIEVEFYDENNMIIGSDSNIISAVGANAEIAIEMWDTPDSFNDYKLYIDVEQTSNTAYFDKIELTHNNNNEEIIVQVKNNSEDTIEYMSVSVVYYQGEQVVGIEEDSEFDIKSGRSANFTISYPYDKNYDDVNFDNYKVFVNEAYSYNW